MDRRTRALVILILVLGPAVLGSYLLAYAYTPEIRDGLWGGVPESLKPLYTVSMFTAAAGFFPFTWRLVLAQDPGRFLEDTGRPWATLPTSYALVLLPSALWLPLTALHLQDPRPWLWWVIRLDLLAVAAGSAGILMACIGLARRRGGAGARAAVAGAVLFFFQTGILDALVWPAFF